MFQYFHRIHCFPDNRFARHLARVSDGDTVPVSAPHTSSQEHFALVSRFQCEVRFGPFLSLTRAGGPHRLAFGEVQRWKNSRSIWSRR